MSFTKQVLWLRCDGGDDDECEVAYEIDIACSAASVARAVAADDGWVYRRGKDYCPACK